MREGSRRFATPFVLGMVIALSMPAVVHAYLGYSIRVVRTGSMQPALSPGDAVLVQAVRAAELQHGDIAILFHPQDGEVEAHRLQSIVVATAGLTLVTKGDANPAADAAVVVPRQSAIERVVTVLPKFGHLITIFDSSVFLGSVCALGLMVLIAFEMQDRRRRLSATPESTTHTVRSA